MIDCPGYLRQLAPRQKKIKSASNPVDDPDPIECDAGNFDGDSLSSDEFEYVLDEENLVCVRTSLHDKSNSLASYPLEARESALDIDPVIAEFPDGDKRAMPGLTAGSLRSSSYSSRGESALWEATQINTNHRIGISQRVDRKLLLSMYEQGSQVLSINLEVFGDIADQHQQLPRSHPIVVKGLKLLTHFGQMFARGECKRSELKEKRDELMQRLGLMLPNGRQVKNSGKDFEGLQCAAARTATTKRPSARESAATTVAGYPKRAKTCDEDDDDDDDDENDGSMPTAAPSSAPSVPVSMVDVWNLQAHEVAKRNPKIELVY